jgi:hypothetical protein
MALQKLREHVASRRNAVTATWKNPPPPVMLAYGAVVLTSGVLFLALGHWSKLRGFVWGSGLTAILDLTVMNESVVVPIEGRGKLSEMLGKILTKVGLLESTKDELNNLFLELVQWELIFVVNSELSEGMREELAAVLRVEGSEDDRSRAIHQFLQKVEIDALKSKKYVDVAVTSAVAGLVTVFESRGYKIAELVSLAMG